MKGIAVFFLILFLLGQVAGGYAQEQAAAPVDQANDPNIWDFGKVNRGEVSRHVFIVKNDSKQTLNIKGVSTSCGCTASKIQKQTLLPGESTNLEVSFNSAGYSGAVQQFAYVQTDNIENPVIRYKIKAEVKIGRASCRERVFVHV
jgi:hypothetical protein